jgi:exonuclease SbcD
VTGDTRSYGERVKGRDDLAIAAEFVKHVRNAPASEAEHQLLTAAFESVREGAC